MSEALRTPCSWNFQYFLSQEYGYFPDDLLIGLQSLVNILKISIANYGAF